MSSSSSSARHPRCQCGWRHPIEEQKFIKVLSKILKRELALRKELLENSNDGTLNADTFLDPAVFMLGAGTEKYFPGEFGVNGRLFQLQNGDGLALSNAQGAIPTPLPASVPAAAAALAPTTGTPSATTAIIAQGSGQTTAMAPAEAARESNL